MIKEIEVLVAAEYFGTGGCEGTDAASK